MQSFSSFPVAVITPWHCIFACDSRYAVAPFSTFKKLAIPGPAPWPFVGNLPEISKKVIIL